LAHTRAARFVYLNRAGFNGLYRVNARGEFNVPFGRYARPLVHPVDRLHKAAALLADATLQVADFEDVISSAKRGDFLYVDPPYTTKHSNNGFLRYNERLFSWADQIRLSECLRAADKRGVLILLSNSSHRTVARLYGQFNAYPVIRPSLVGTATSRGSVVEMLWSNFQLFGDNR
jgi:DNA adenine methylase